MKNIIITVIYGTILGNAMPAFAVECHRACTQLELQSAHIVNDSSSCAELKNEPCEDGIIFASCVSCLDEKAQLVRKTEVFDGCSYTYTTCGCPSCTGCTSDSSWVSAGAGYEKKTTASCDCGTCTKTTSYRCAAGYYGTSTNGSTGCTKCPSSGGVAGLSAAGSKAITSCYIPSGSSFSDSTGSGTYTGNCYYSK